MVDQYRVVALREMSMLTREVGPPGPTRDGSPRKKMGDAHTIVLTIGPQRLTGVLTRQAGAAKTHNFAHSPAGKVD